MATTDRPESEAAVAAASPQEQAALELAKFLSYAVVLAAAIAFYVVATGLPTSRWEPLGAGAFPRLVMLLLGGLCVIALVDSGRKLRRHGLPHELGARARAFVVGHRLVILVFLAFAGYLLVLKPLGFPLATLVFLLVAQLVAARRSARTLTVAAIVAVVFSFGLNTLFAEVFLVFLPRGVFG